MGRVVSCFRFNVIPAKAGIHANVTPAFAGMTVIFLFDLAKLGRYLQKRKHYNIPEHPQQFLSHQNHLSGLDQTTGGEPAEVDSAWK